MTKTSQTITDRRNRQISLGLRGEPDTRPLSRIELFTGYRDAGPCEPGSPSAFCPHCGSGGRRVWSFVCVDGTRRGAMAGCIKLFDRSKLAADQMNSLDRLRKDQEAYRSGVRKYPPASWDAEIGDVSDRLHHGQIEIWEAKELILAALQRRAIFLARKKRR